MGKQRVRASRSRDEDDPKEKKRVKEPYSAAEAEDRQEVEKALDEAPSKKTARQGGRGTGRSAQSVTRQERGGNGNAVFALPVKHWVCLSCNVDVPLGTPCWKCSALPPEV